MKKISLFCTIAMVLTLSVVPALGQLNPFAPPEASEPIVSASPSGSLNSSTYVSRAEGAAAAANAPRAPSRPSGVTSAIEGGPYGGAGRDEAAAAPSAPSEPAPNYFQAVQTPAIRMVKVLGGERVKCAVCGRILEDINYENVPETALEGNYYDDGTHGDQEAGDGLYTNITERSDVVGRECNRIKLQLLSLLRTTEEMTPLEFFGIHVATNEPISTIPRNMTKERLRDERLKEWNRKFLRMFRKNPDDPTSEFYPVYVPRPPKAPFDNPPMPAAWNPVEMERLQAEAESAQAGGTSGGGYRGGMSAASAIEGGPTSGHQGQYYDAGKMR